MGKNNASLPDVETLMAMGINPKNNLPYKMGSSKGNLKPEIKKVLRIVDEQNAINKFIWYNLPKGLNSQLIERILYYKGQGAFFYMPTNSTFYFLPYALDGSIDVYGRYMGITPLPFHGSASGEKGKDKPWITGLTREPVYDIILPEDLKYSDLETKCVLLHDYSNQISQTNISRQILNDPILDVMADCIPFLRTSLLNSTGVQGVRVDNQDGAANVMAASEAIDIAALTGEKFVPIVDAVEIQELTGGNVTKSEEFLLAMQSLDNFRLETHGLENGGLFQKKAHMLSSEQAVNGGQVELILQDGLTLRQNFANIVNSIWGLGIWCEVSESAIGLDKNLDGEISNEQDGQTPIDMNTNEGGMNEQ